MVELVVKNATLPEGRTGLDIAVRDGRIAAVEANIAAEAPNVIDAGGYLVAPPFIDSHVHSSTAPGVPVWISVAAIIPKA